MRRVRLCVTVELSRTTGADVAERVQHAQVWESWPQPLHVPVCYPQPPSATHPMSYLRGPRSLPAKASPAEPPQVEFLACPGHDLRAHLTFISWWVTVYSVCLRFP